jgi:hypothetical protein
MKNLKYEVSIYPGTCLPVEIMPCFFIDLTDTIIKSLHDCNYRL